MNFRYSTTLQIVLGLCVALFLGVNPIKAEELIYSYTDIDSALLDVSSGLGINPSGYLHKVTQNYTGYSYMYYKMIYVEEGYQAPNANCKLYGAIYTYPGTGNTITQVATSTNYVLCSELPIASVYATTYNEAQHFIFNYNLTANQTYFFAVRTQGRIGGEDMRLVTEHDDGNNETGDYVNSYAVTDSNTHISTFVRDEHVWTYYTQWQPGDPQYVDSPDWQGTIQVGFLDGVEFPQYTKCIVGEDCFLSYRYGYQTIGKNLYLIKKENYFLPIYNPNSTASASSTLANSLLLKGTFDVASSTIGQQEYCFYLMANTSISAEDETACGIYVDYVEDPEIDRLLNLISCSCEDIATSTSWYEFLSYDSFVNGIDCGFRKVTCWALKPSKSAINQFSTAVNDINNVFPLTIYHQIDTSIQSLGNSTSSMAITLDGFFPGDNSDYIVLAPTTFETKLGTVWTTFYQSMEYIFYFLTFMYFLNFVLGGLFSGNKSSEAEMVEQYQKVRYVKMDKSQKQVKQNRIKYRYNLR